MKGLSTAVPAEVHLKRAWGFATSLDESLEEFRNHLLDHDTSCDDLQGVGGFVTALRNKGNLGRERLSLIEDVNLALKEIERATAVDSKAVLVLENGTELNETMIRAIIISHQAQIEYYWGDLLTARNLFHQSLEIYETAWCAFMLGCVYEFQFEITRALEFYQRSLEIEPDGELSVSALRKVNELKNYRKRFRGSKLLLAVLLLSIYGSPFAVWYFVAKRK